MSDKSKPVRTRDLDPELKEILGSMPEVSLKPIWMGLTLVLLVWCFGFVPWFLQFEEWPWELTLGLDKAGEFGDSFGFINSLISSLALVGVIAAIWLQKQELAEQRKELIITQWELRKSADAQEQSQLELAKQAKIHLQATLLTAIDGWENSIDKGERRVHQKFIGRLRQMLILNVLDPKSSEGILEEIASKLKEWQNLTYILDSCHEISVAIQSVEKRIPLELVGKNEYEQPRIDDLRGRLESLQDKVRSKATHFDKAFATVFPNTQPAVEWLAVIENLSLNADWHEMRSKLQYLDHDVVSVLQSAHERRTPMEE
ncbi:hypothetical protein AB1L30_06555 [Bremerella sp. JC817]|uniref:hypothetical protein n=1 Tax=Bremerella sp. JC817 TaxID=3231756 RepID=UPI0034589E4B